MVLPGAIPYPQHEIKGYWGPVTATIDWCEENYVVTRYVAEAINTATNALFVMIGLFAVSNAIRHRYEARFLLSALGFVLVGVGSWLFHMTLWYEFQLLDELPMIYATCIPCWGVFQYGKTPAQSRQVAATIAFGAALLTAIYLWLRDPTIHQAAYGLLNIVIMLKSIRQSIQHVKDPVAFRRLNTVLALGVVEFLVGWAIWNADIHLCPSWRRWRRSVGMPYGFVLEGHGWWHLLTGMGIYCYLVYQEYLRTFLVQKENEFEFVWRFYAFPVLERRKTLKKD